MANFEIGRRSAGALNPQGGRGGHLATVEDIIERVQSRNKEVTVSTIYRILDSFRSANILSFIYHPDTGKCYYDITVAEHHHLFDGKSIEDYADPELSQLIREYLEQVTLKKNV
ncbi:transcriptional repressor [Alistipes sp. An54]|uniref:transcriptional repressor n=1 Tax=Alistipes sp. An54 TaxID=1965645 RepID=UPI001F150DA6|nr:transcriptional repressor [Alistipes sp. An54]